MYWQALAAVMRFFRLGRFQDYAKSTASETCTQLPRMVSLAQPVKKFQTLFAWGDQDARTLASIRTLATKHMARALANQTITSDILNPARVRNIQSYYEELHAILGASSHVLASSAKRGTKLL